jgi:hypothetical protein
MRTLFFSFLAIAILSSFNSISDPNDDEVEDQIIQIINVERYKLNLPALYRNYNMDLACDHHGEYLEKLRDFLGSRTFIEEGRKQINGTPKSHFETVDFNGFNELLTPTNRVARYTQDSDSLSCECASFYESDSKKNALNIIDGFRGSQSHWNVLMMKDLLKYWGQPKSNITQIGISLKRKYVSGKYITICVINTK